MLKKRRGKRATPAQINALYRQSNLKTMTCSTEGCNTVSHSVGADAVSFICWKCTYDMAPYCPPQSSSPEENLPRGWHRKKIFESPLGKFYSYGTEITKKEAQALRAEVVIKKDLPKDKRTRGWHKKKLYISPSGIAYSYGKEINNAEKERIFKEIS